MKDVVFVTGNANKAKYLSKYLGFYIDHASAEVDEIQSDDIEAIAVDKAMRVYDQIKRPVLVEDTGLALEALQGMPGPFVKFFVTKVDGVELLCRMLDGFSTRNATGHCVFAYYDGVESKTFHGSVEGVIAHSPGQDNGFGWDRIFIPSGYTTVRSELNEEDYKKIYLKIKPIEQVASFLSKIS